MKVVPREPNKRFKKMSMFRVVLIFILFVGMITLIFGGTKDEPHKVLDVQCMKWCFVNLDNGINTSINRLIKKNDYVCETNYYNIISYWDKCDAVIH